MNNQQKQNIMAEEILLNYFNGYLYKNNIITEVEKNKINNKISILCDNKRKTSRKH